MIHIRGTHPDSYRSGEWAHLFSVQHTTEGKDIWIVEFLDGDSDAWPSWDTSAGYEVRIQLEHPNGVPDDSSQEASTRTAREALLLEAHARTSRRV